MEGPGTPGSKKTGAERTREYGEKNEQAAKLSVLKFQVKTAQKMASSLSQMRCKVAILVDG